MEEGQDVWRRDKMCGGLEKIMVYQKIGGW